MGEKIKAYLKRNYRILTPYIGIAFVVVFFTERIPYVNQYAHEFIFIVLVAEWLVLMYAAKISIKTTIKMVLTLFAVAFLLSLVGLTFYSEVIGNFIYGLLFIIAISILLDKEP